MKAKQIALVPLGAALGFGLWWLTDQQTPVVLWLIGAGGFGVLIALTWWLNPGGRPGGRV